MKECVICGKPNSHIHHIIYRSKCKPLEHCKHNLICLCQQHHQGTYGVHGKYGKDLNMMFKLEFQKWLENHLKQDRYRLEDIEKILEISYRASISLSKLLKSNQGYFIREDIIRACMGGKLYEKEHVGKNVRTI